MSDKVLIFVADEKYLPHYKSLAVNCQREGNWDGDYAFIVPTDMDAGDLTSRGFHVLATDSPGFLAKFEIFNPFFEAWDTAMYLDADVIVQSSFQPLFEQLEHWPKNVYDAKPILANREEVPVFMGWQIWDKEWQSHTAEYERMRDHFPHVFTQDKMWSTACLLFEPAGIPEGTLEHLHDLQHAYYACNDPAKGGTDEQIIDLYLHNWMEQVGEKGWCYWGLDEAASRVPSLARAWRGDEVPVIVHYTRWYAHWIVKEPGVHAYDNDRVGRVCHEFYADNLAAFETVFPRNA